MSSGEIVIYLNSHFSNMDAEINGYTPHAREVWSRLWTLAIGLWEKDGDETAIQIVFDQAIEGHLTRGGCIQGRINRGFVGYIKLLSCAGTNLHN